MIRNTNPKNRCVTWDLTPPEIEQFYKGAGSVTVFVDHSSTIVGCIYHDRLPNNPSAYSLAVKRHASSIS